MSKSAVRTQLLPVEARLPLFGGSIRMAQVCDWCGRPAPRTLGSYHVAGVWFPTAPISLCKLCEAYTSAAYQRWSDVQARSVEVLSLTAAEIVRAAFTPIAVRSTFVFKVCEPEQTYFGVWRECTASTYQEVKNSRESLSGPRWELAVETYDTFVPFTLLATADGKQLQYLKRSAQFFAGVSKLSKAAGVLGKMRRA